jgi:carbon storage regulator
MQPTIKGFIAEDIAMLVLTRKVDERIQVGKDVVITIVRVRGGAVRVGIEAPKEVRVKRSELEDKKDER